jgi:hypothetical protein
MGGIQLLLYLFQGLDNALFFLRSYLGNQWPGDCSQLGGRGVRTDVLAFCQKRGDMLLVLSLFVSRPENLFLYFFLPLKARFIQVGESASLACSSKVDQIFSSTEALCWE